MTFNIKTPQEVLFQTVERMKSKRLQMNITQEGLALRAGVSLGTIKHFEKSANVSFKTLLNIAMALDCLDDFENILKTDDKPVNLFMEEEPQKRQRGRIK